MLEIKIDRKARIQGYRLSWAIVIDHENQLGYYTDFPQQSTESHYHAYKDAATLFWWEE